MLTYTHVSRIGSDVVGPDGKTSTSWKVVQTPGVKIPTTLDDVIALMELPEYNQLVKFTLNEQGGDLKQVVEAPAICKLIANSIGLKVNATARQGDGIDPLKLAGQALASGDADLAKEVTAAMAGGKDALKAWAKSYSGRM